jgi:peptidoglycan-N-acetylglucosamine deacetylase
MDRRRPVTVSLLALGGLVSLALLVRGSPSHSRAAAARAHARAAVHRASASVGARRNARADAAVVARFLHRHTTIRIGTRRRREAALTFDDGPSIYTRRVVRALRRAHVAATFFPTGLMLESHPAPLATVVRAGFPVGDHTVNHVLLAPLPGAGQRREIRGQERRVRRLGLPPPRLFRPPYGSYDTTTVGIVRSLGMANVLWSVDSRDYTRPGRKAIVRNVLGGVRPGAIVLMHDGGGDRSQTVAALPAIIRRLERRGYRLVTVPELLRPLGTSLRTGWTVGR